MPDEYATSDQRGKPFDRAVRSTSPETASEDRPLRLRIREVRDLRGLSQKALATRAGISQSYLAEVEKGRKGIKATNLKALADALDVRVGELVDDPEDPGFATVSAAFGRLSESNQATVMTLISALDSAGRETT